MNVAEKCIMTKELAEEDLWEISGDSFLIGMLLANQPLSLTSSYLKVLLEIAMCEDHPEYIQIGALSKFYKLIPSLPRDTENGFEEILKILNISFPIFSDVVHRIANKNILSLLLKCFNRAIQKIAFDLRTQIEVVSLVISSYSLREYINIHTVLFRMPIELLTEIKDHGNMDPYNKLEIIRRIYQYIVEFNASDSDLIKNIGFTLIILVMRKIQEDEVLFKKLCEILKTFKGYFTKYQKIKLFSIYEDHCRAYSLNFDDSVFDQKSSKNTVSNIYMSVWDDIEDSQDLVVKTEADIVPIAGLEEKIKDLEQRFTRREYINKNEVKDKIKDHLCRNELFDTCAKILESNENCNGKFWNFFLSVVRQGRYLEPDLLLEIEKKLKRPSYYKGNYTT